jgi:gliding motility-associated-like protein
MLLYILKLFVKLFSFVLFILTCANAEAQQQCQGSLGDPIINNTFGAGSNPGPPLAAATTAYQYKNGDCPPDGFYTVISNTNNCFGNSWHSITSDHTGNANGYFMLVNAKIEPSAFFIDTVRGLCSNTTFEFAAWIVNVLKPSACGSNGIQPNVTFSIEKLDGTVLQTSNTGNIISTSSPQWEQKVFFFTTPLGVSDIILRMTNNAAGGCGNDLALDDITFRACGPLLTPNIGGFSTPSTNASHCEGVAKNYSFTCSVSPGFNNPSYQWQQSFNGIPYTDINGQNSQSLSKNFLASASIGTWRFRLSVAETGNLNSPQCRISSQPITINILPKISTTATSNSTLCEGATLQLTATGGNTYDWSGPNIFSANGNTVALNNVTQINAGKYYVLVKNAGGCENLDSTTVIINPAPNAITAFADSTICMGESLNLIVTGGGFYEWIPAIGLDNANSATPLAKPTTETDYSVVVTNQFSCTDTAYTIVKVIKKPIVDAGPDKVIVANRPIILEGNIVGDIDHFIWSPAEFINDVNILNPTVNPPSEKKYYLKATATKNCGTSIDSMYVKIYQGIFIPNSFTPNGDYKNDIWNVPALEAFPLHELTIYNRYGQIMFSRKQSFDGWNGKYKGEALPSGAYTYIIDLKNGSPLLLGSILLIR